MIYGFSPWVLLDIWGFGGVKKHKSFAFVEKFWRCYYNIRFHWICFWKNLVSEIEALISHFAFYASLGNSSSWKWGRPEWDLSSQANSPSTVSLSSLRKRRNGFVPSVFLLAHHDIATQVLLAWISTQKYYYRYKQIYFFNRIITRLSRLFLWGFVGL